MPGSQSRKTSDAVRDLESLLKSRTGGTNSRVFSEALIDEFGGERSLAKTIVQLFHDTKSDQHKVRLLTATMEFMTKSSPKDGGLPGEKRLSDDELKANIGQLLEGLSSARQEETAADELEHGTADGGGIGVPGAEPGTADSIEPP